MIGTILTDSVVSHADLRVNNKVKPINNTFHSILPFHQNCIAIVQECFIYPVPVSIHSQIIRSMDLSITGITLLFHISCSRPHKPMWICPEGIRVSPSFPRESAGNDIKGPYLRSYEVCPLWYLHSFSALCDFHL